MIPGSLMLDPSQCRNRKLNPMDWGFPDAAFVNGCRVNTRVGVGFLEIRWRPIFNNNEPFQ
jgi:hypothetical protein